MMGMRFRSALVVVVGCVVVAGCGGSPVASASGSVAAVTSTVQPTAAPIQTSTRASTSAPTQTAVPTPVPSLSGGYPLMPDRMLTPGVVAVTDLQVVCHTSTSARRNVSAAVRAQVFAAYQVVGSHIGYELDHLIPLELGGSNAAGNLWPEHSPGFHTKDLLENRLHARVCAGALDLVTAQHAIAGDWQAAAVAYP